MPDAAPEKAPDNDDPNEPGAPPTMLLHERIWKTVQAFLSEYDALTVTDAIGVLEIVKHDLIQDISCPGDCDSCSCGDDDEEDEEDDEFKSNPAQ